MNTPQPPTPARQAPPAARLYTPAEAAQLLAVPESWLRRKAGRRLIPCTKLGKHLRFSATDLTQITDTGQQAARLYRRGTRLT
jgi:excisionase family DNA binding protein